MNRPFAALRHALTFKMTAKQYFVYQTFGSIFVNGVLNAGSMWFKRRQAVVPFWGWSGIAFDTLLTTFTLSALTVVFGTFAIHHDFKAGRFEMLTWTPRNHRVLKLFSYSTPLRATVFGPLFTLVLVPPTLGALMLAGVHELRFWPFFAFKVLYAVILGMAVTPLNALWVLTSPKRTFWEVVRGDK